MSNSINYINPEFLNTFTLDNFLNYITISDSNNENFYLY